FAAGYAVDGAPATQEESEQNSGGGPDQNQGDDADQQLAGLCDLRFHGLGNLGEIGFEVDCGQQFVALFGNGVAADQSHQRSAAAHLEGGFIGVQERLGPGLLGLIAGLYVSANPGFLGGGDLRGRVVDDGERGRAGAQRVVGGDGLSSAVEADQFGRQHTACGCIADRTQGIVGG